MLLGERRKRLGETREIALQEPAGSAKLQHQGGVSEVLARGAEMDMPRGIAIDLRDRLAEPLHQWNGQRAGMRGGFGELAGIEFQRVSRFRDGSGGVSRNDTAFGFRFSQAGLEGKRVRDQRLIGEDRRHLGGRGHAGLDQGRHRPFPRAGVGGLTPAGWKRA